MKEKHQCSEHTPGPWIVDRGDYWDKENPPKSGPCVGSVEIGLITVAIRAQPTNAACPKLEALKAEGEVNAHLIAAAPDLLAALEKIQANAGASATWIRYVAEEAIAKAKGGAA
jgi:hypothetical protein